MTPEEVLVTSPKDTEIEVTQTTQPEPFLSPVCSFMFVDKPIDLTLKETLVKLKEETNKLLELKRGQADDELKQFYRESLIPSLIGVRKLNRVQQTCLDSELKKLRQLNQKIIESQMNKDCFLFEASRLEAESADIRKSYSSNEHASQDSQSIPISSDKTEEQMLEEHKVRLQQLDGEKERRKELWKKLASVQEDTNDIEQKSSKCAGQLQIVKPIMSKLVTTVQSTIKNEG